MFRSRRSTRVFIIALGVAVAGLIIGALAGTIAPIAALLATVGYMGLAAYALLNFRFNDLRRRLTNPIGPALRATPAAKKAVERARNRGGAVDVMILMDVGNLVNEKARSGKWNRRISDQISLDDQFVQPYINLHVLPGNGDRQVQLQFEFIDQSGEIRFSHNMQQFVRDGDNLITCERQLALRGNPELARGGMWDLRVSVDGNPTGVHVFNVRAANTLTDPVRDSAHSDSAERYNASSSRLAEQDESIAMAEPEDRPLSLEELIRQQNRDQA